MNTKAAIRHVLTVTQKSKYRLARDLDIAPIMIDNYMNSTRMGIKTYEKFKNLFPNTIIDDVYDPVSHITEDEG